MKIAKAKIKTENDGFRLRVNVLLLIIIKHKMRYCIQEMISYKS